MTLFPQIERWDFQQDASPGNPGEDGLTWYRTSDREAFYWNNAQAHWESFATMEWGCTSEEGDVPARSTELFLYNHQLLANTTNGQSWRPEHDIFVTHVIGRRSSIPNSDSEILVYSGGTTLYAGTFGATDRYYEDLSANFNAAANNRLSIRAYTGDTGPVAVYEFGGNIRFKFRVEP